MDEKRLLRLAKFVDPGLLRRGIVWAQDQRLYKGALLELFLAAVCRLCTVRPTSTGTQGRPANSGGKSKDKTSSKTERVYNQKVLERALVKFWGMYRMSVALRHCLDWGNLHAAMVVYRCAGQVSDAFELTLLAAAHRLQGLHACSRTIVVEVRLSVMADMLAVLSDKDGLASVPNPSEQARLLALLLSFWRQAHFPMAKLEDSLLAHMESLAAPLAVLLFQTNAKPAFDEAVQPETQQRAKHVAERVVDALSPHVPLPLPLALSEQEETTEDYSEETKWPHLSARLYLAVTLQQLHLAARKPSSSTLGRLGDIGRGGVISGRLLQASAGAVNRLWGEIRGKLSRDVNAGHTQGVSFSSLSYLPGVDLDGPGGLAVPRRPVDTRDPDLLAFTCGHVFQKRCFYEEVLPGFLHRLEFFSPRLPVTAKLLAAEYSQTTMALSCPTCVLVVLNQEHQSCVRQASQHSKHYN